MDTTMSVLASPRDLPFFADVVRHLMRKTRHPIKHRSLILDIWPHEHLSEMRRAVSVLVADNVVDEVIEIKDLTRDHRGVPFHGWTAGLGAFGDTQFHVHYDCDILLYQEPGHCWISEGIAVMKKEPSILFVAPLPGPPRADGQLLGQTDHYHAAHGCHLFKSFSSRRFLTDRARLAHLPIEQAYISQRRRVLSLVTGNSALHTWETSVSTALKHSPFFRAHLMNPKAWSLHAPNHGSELTSNLAELIQRIERGDYPIEQAGRYDLDVSLWIGTKPTLAEASPQYRRG